MAFRNGCVLFSNLLASLPFTPRVSRLPSSSKLDTRHFLPFHTLLPFPPLKIVHICNLPLSPDHPDHARVATHPGRWVLNLALAQARHTDLRPELVVPVPGTHCNHSTLIEGIPVHFLATPTRLRSATFFWFDARRIARVVRSLQPDLVHAHGTEDAHGLAALRSGRPSVITSQGLHFMINALLCPSFFSRERIVQCTEGACLRRARHLIAKSEYVRTALTSRFPNLITHLIPNTFDPFLETLQEKREPGTVIFVAIIAPRKGLHDLREAARLLKDRLASFSLWVVGNGTPPRSEYEAKEIQALMEIMGNRVRFWGTLPATKTASLVARSCLLVAPSIEEMFGNQVIEALLVGTPVIVADQTAMAENVRRFGNGQVVPQANPRALADAMERALHTPPSPEVAAKARQAIHEWMSPERVARLHREVYETILAGR